MSNVEPNLWGDHASTESRMHRGWHRSYNEDDRGRSHTRQASQGRSVDDEQGRATVRRARSRRGLASRFTTFLRLMAGTTVGSKKAAKKRRPERHQQDMGSSSSESSEPSEESESPGPFAGHGRDIYGPDGPIPGMPVQPPSPQAFAQMPPRHPPFQPQGPKPPGPPFFNQPPFRPGPAPHRPSSSLQSGSESSSSSQSSTEESSHSVDNGPPDIPAHPPVPQRTAFYGEPKYAEYQLPGNQQVPPEPAFPSALAEDVTVSPWTDVTRVSWTKGRVGEVEDENLESVFPSASPPPFPPGPSGSPFGAQPPPAAFQAPLQPGNMPPPGMQPFSGGMPFVSGNRPFPTP